ncbi:hypothetical protein ACFU9X_34320, partial [Streptomyces atratus]|uniref:hypothetical protein n=1 Tax=Streptomyces atratus TaxID=1893 RepID=UPI0036986364
MVVYCQAYSSQETRAFLDTGANTGIAEQAGVTILPRFGEAGTAKPWAATSRGRCRPGALDGT